MLPGALNSKYRVAPAVYLMSQLYRMLLGVLCVWRVTHLLQAEDGPWDLVVRIRQLAGEGFLGKVLDCFHCLSLWISLPFSWVLGQTATERGWLWLALSAGAIVLEHLTAATGSKDTDQQRPATFVEDTEE